MYHSMCVCVFECICAFNIHFSKRTSHFSFLYCKSFTQKKKIKEYPHNLLLVLAFLFVVYINAPFKKKKKMVEFLKITLNIILSILWEFFIDTLRTLTFEKGRFY